MKIGILIALLTILLMPEMIRAQSGVPRAVVISIKGKARIKRNKSTREENLPRGANLYTADRIKCDKGCTDLKISYCNIYPKSVARGPSWTTILALNCGAKPDGTRGGAPKGEGISIISPRESEFIQPEEFSLRWEPDRSVSKVDIEVKIHLGEDVWSQKGVDGSKGSFESDDLRAKLKENQMNNVLVFDVTLRESKNNNERNSENRKQRVTFRLISDKDQEDLTNGLRFIEGEPDGILRAIGRGLEFNEYQLYSDALREIEQALERAYDQKANEETITAINNLAILMNFQVYNDARVEQLCSSQKRSRSFLKPCVLIGKQK